jgi:cytochrome c biogenesis protein
LNNDSKDFVDSLWRFFSSLKLTLFLLMGLATVSIIGTLIKQNAEPDVYVEKFGAGLAKLFTALNFVDMYHSLWFLLLLYFLSLNIIACTLRRLPFEWKSISQSKTTLDEAFEKTLPCREEWKTSGSVQEIENRVTEILRREFAGPRSTTAGNETHLFAEKGRYSRIGVYILHASIIIILAGAMIGNLFGYKASVSIEEGKGTTTAYASKRNFHQSLLERMGKNSGTETVVSPDDPSPRIAIDLGFTVQCDKFSVTYYDTGAPKEYKSLLSIADEGKTVIARRPVVVNGPLTYRGITFYQSGYSAEGFRFTLRDRQNGASSQVTAKSGERTLLPNGDSMVVMDSIEDIRAQSHEFSGPAVRVAVLPKTGKPEAFVLLQKYPDFSADQGGAYRFSYDGISTWNTVLQVSRDPGVWIVWAGCFLLVGGIFVSFFLSHRRIWIRISDGCLVMAGSSGKNSAAFRTQFDNLAAKLKKM